MLAASAPPALAGGTYVALGDSVSAGFGVAQDRAFVDRYFAYLRDPANGGLDQLVNLAVPGESSSSMRSAGGQLERAVLAIDGPSDTAVVTLGIGGIDMSPLSGLCFGSFSVPSCQFTANYLAILEELGRALADDPGSERFQVLEYYNPWSGTASEEFFVGPLLGQDGRLDCSGEGAALGLNDLIACVGRSKGAMPVDVLPTFSTGGQLLMSDDAIHPNEFGHASIACLFEHPERTGSPTPCLSRPLAGRGAQRVLRQGGLRLIVENQEPLTVTASGSIVMRGGRRSIKFSPVTRRVAAQTPTKLKLRLSRPALGLIRRALRLRRPLKARVSVRSGRPPASIPLAATEVQLLR